MEIDELFKSFLKEIEQEVASNVYTTWFSELKPVSLSDTKLTIQIPMIIHRNILSNNYKDLIDDQLYKLTNKHYEIEYITKEEYELAKKEETQTTVLKSDNIKEIITNEDSEENDYWETNLNPKFTFDNFEIGDSNRFAVVSAHNVADNPGNGSNPLFLYGRSGIGKTHLVEAIGNYIADNTNKHVLYVTSGQFKEDYANISSFNGPEKIKYAKEFKNKYQNVDVLIMDDIQFLVDAEKTQAEFFQTFNILHQNGKQIIISSDSSPDDLKKIEERLRSRFYWGLSVNIYPPDYELRCKIIKRKLKNTILENRVEDEVIEYIANACQTDVRQIEGTINKLLAYTALMNPKKIDLEFSNEAISDYVTNNPYQNGSISKIQKIVADYFNITVFDLKSKKKTANIAKPRHIAMYLCRVLTDEGLSRIGLEFGGRDHSTVSSSYDKITNDLKIDKKLNLIVEELKNKL